MKTGIITTDTYLNHHTGQGHPERADRVTVIINHLKKEKSKDLIWKKTKKFDSKYLQFTHDKNYLNNGLNLLKKIIKFSIDNQGFPKSRSIKQLILYLKYFIMDLKK